MKQSIFDQITSIVTINTKQVLFVNNKTGQMDLRT